MPLCKNHHGFDRLSTQSIRNANNAALSYRRMFQQNVFYFIRADTETAGFYNVVKAAVEPEISVFVLPGSIAGVINTTPPDMLVLGFIVQISTENTWLMAVFWRNHDNFSDFPFSGRFAFPVLKLNVKHRRRYAH